MASSAFFRRSLSAFLNSKSALKGSPGLLSLSTRFLSSEAMDKFENIKVSELKPFVYNVEINRPKKRNCCNDQTWSELEDAFNQLSVDPDCRSIVFSGSGKMFCAGIDVQDLMKIAEIFASDDDAVRKSKTLYQYVVKLQGSITAIEKCNKPVIAAIHNGCIGGGVDLVTACDIRMCSQDAYFNIKEVDLGLAADIGTLQRLPKIIGSTSLGYELAYTCRNLESAEALTAGLVSKVSPSKESLMEEATKMAEIIAQKSPVAIQSTKKNILYARDHTVDDSLDYIARWNSLHLQTGDLTVAATSTFMKSSEPPTFAKL